jgi:glycosyltransferase involved in cell wall biosynthesis
MKVPVSVVIPVLNEENNLPRCLDSVSWADEVFVVDSGSTDRSVSIAEEHGAKVVQFKFSGTWPKKKNWALDNLPFSHEWVLILDADEAFPPEAEAEIREVSTSNKQGCDGYFMNRRFMFMGKWLKFAYHPNWTMRIFKRRLGRYEKLTDFPTESGDNEVHEHIMLNGKAGHLRSKIDHYAFPTVESFVEKHNRYSNWEARVALDRYFKPESAGKLKSKEIGSRRRLRALSKHLPLRPLLRFLYIYVLQRGFLDGWEGYYFARLHAFYEFLCVCKTYELRKNRKK